MSGGWKAGQQVAIGYETATIDRVTPSGQAVVGTRRFAINGREIGGPHNSWMRDLTPDVAHEIEHQQQTNAASIRLSRATDTAEKWYRSNASNFRRGYMTPEQIATANRLAEAIERALGDAP